ncbi:chloroplastic group IIA intron splicing facilitator CRS1, chloroplastic [Impatiens glandulifera]|uniref:chloroplastic group IIA intron splicing facilitator CRS1, chloroplastic n=1 Tax=Impatiens glandulifera TaxID=253017 RepID=UPI001FB190A9|nr:chloroplastic group IIA intron splicing facilitator CRS1, chloroplastic [Impatiens glandulifera]
MVAALFLSPPPPPTRHSSYVSLSFKPLIISSLNTSKNETGGNRSSNSDSSFSHVHLSQTDDGLCPKAPTTAPWMRVPTVANTAEVLDLSETEMEKGERYSELDGKVDKSLTEKVGGGRGRKAMKKIYEGMTKLREFNGSEEKREYPEKFESELLIDQNPWEMKTNKMPWDKEEKLVFRRMKKERVATAAELSLDPELLQRLRDEARVMRNWVKVMKAGVTQSVLDQIHLIWKHNELVLLKFDLPLCRNMDRAREIVETKTVGLVVWCKKDLLAIYRGCDYKPWKTTSKTNREFGLTDMDEENILVNKSLYERETDRLLDDLGPRFVDWWMSKPLPVDGDLLPEIIPGFKSPARLYPFGRSKLTDYDLTYLRKLTHPLPTHFVLGRNRKLQGVAAAILKLWEKCHIAKIALKWGVPNTSNEEMADELKRLTGGVLLLRNKYYILLYRGKDFLPSSVAKLVVEREMEIKRYQLHEEAARLKAATEAFNIVEEQQSTIGSLSEFEKIQSERVSYNNGNLTQVQLEAEKERLERELNSQERKLMILNKKIERSEKELAKLNSLWKPAELEADQEIITDEERECFRKIGLKLNSTLILGRRGIFDGVMEGMRQHWKHRELVKVITMQRLLSQVIYTAKRLEAESGGILVSVDKMKHGHAIIIYRGKNYTRPKLLPRNLLSKRKALFRSLEMQRLGSLKFYAYQRQKSINDLKFKWEDLQEKILTNDEDEEEEL